MSGHPPVRVGLIGAGSIARAHAIAYASARTYCGPEVPEARLVRLADVDEALAKTAAARLGFEAWTTDWEEVVASPDVDLVSIVTPNFLHAPMAIAAAAAGKHVLCEKPLAATAAEGERMYRAAAAAGVVHAVNFNYRKVPAVRFIARLLREGRIGEVRHLRGVFLQDWGNEARLPRSWKFAAAGAGAGALAGVGSHVIDLARHQVGEFERVAATTATWIAERPVATTCRAFEAVRGETATAPVDVDDSAYVLGQLPRAEPHPQRAPARGLLGAVGRGGAGTLPPAGGPPAPASARGDRVGAALPRERREQLRYRRVPRRQRRLVHGMRPR